jgi:hypothetical protein
LSWRRAAELARAQADAARTAADATGVDENRLAHFKRYLQAYDDQKALVAWVQRRKAQHLEEFAGLCQARQDTDITVIERGPRKS